MDKQIIHVDMDAFFAAVEVRDDPTLAGKPLIIGALPHERGVVSTCSYEARKFGIRSGMSIKDAYRNCPDGIYMHPNMKKYHMVSKEIREIWRSYTDLVECIALDEGYLDVTGSAHLYGGARKIAQDIKRRIREQTSLTCSAGLGYNMMTAKLASEENKPDGYFEITNSVQLRQLIYERDVSILYGVGKKTAEALHKARIYTVRDIYQNQETIVRMFKNQGRKILEYAQGIDLRAVTPYTQAKSIGKEHTFQEDIEDFDFLRDALLLIAKELSFEIHEKGIYSSTITLKITYGNMQAISRSKTGESTNRADEIFAIARELLDKIERKPVRLIGISLTGLSNTGERQISLLDMERYEQKEKLDAVSFQLQKKFGKHTIKTAKELEAEKRIRDGKDETE